MNVNPTVQREIKSVVDLALAHAHKIYYSGPLVRRVERLPDGNKPVRDDGWVDVWAQLGGTTLSVWDMKAIEEASKRGEEVPPSYINVTDSVCQYYVDYLGVAEYSSQVYSSLGRVDKPSDCDFSCEKMHERNNGKYSWIQPNFFRLSIFCCAGFMGHL